MAALDPNNVPTTPPASPSDCVALVSELVDGDEITAQAVSSLLQATSPFMPWRRFDEAIRKVTGSGAWQELQPADVDVALALAAELEPDDPTPEGTSIWIVRYAVAQIAAAHPNGQVRLRAVESLRPDRHPLALVERALDWVPAVRESAASMLSDQWQRHRSSSPSIVAAQGLVTRVASIRRCPTLVPLAIEVAGSRPPESAARVFWSHERRRRTKELLRNLRSADCEPSKPEQQSTRDALITFHESQMANAS